MSKFIETELSTAAGVSGHYKLQIREIDGSLVRELEFDNLITNNGMDRFFDAWSGILRGESVYCQVGTGTAVPAYTDTALTSYFSEVGRSAIVSESSGVQATAPYYSYNTVTYRFPVGTFNNTVITEVGMRPQVLFSHALITDNNGTPTPITLTSGQSLDITYTLKLVPPTVDTTFSTTISGTNYTVTCRPYGVNTESANNNGGYYGWKFLTNNKSNFVDGGSGVDMATINGHHSSGNSSSEPPYGSTMTYPAPQFASVFTNTSLVDQTETQLYYTGSNSLYSVQRYAYTAGNRYLDFSYTWQGAGGNIGGITTFRVAYMNGGAWQYLFNQAIPKTSSNTLILNTRVSLARL